MLRTTDAILTVYFGNDGVEIKRVHLEGLQFPAAVEPDSLREKMLEMACNPPKPAIKPVPKADSRPSAPSIRQFERPPYSLTALSTSQKKPAGGSKLAGLKPAKARRQPDLKCLPQGPASASEAPRPAPSTPTQQLSDAGSDGMFN